MNNSTVSSPAWIAKILQKNFGFPSITTSSTELETLAKLLLVHSQPRSEQILRLVFEATAAKLPLSIRSAVTTLLKKFRNPQGRIEIPDLAALTCFQLVKKIRTSHSLRYFYGDFQGAICLTHDVDNAVGWDMLPEIARLDESYSIPATFNLLTRADYTVDRSTLKELVADGHEIGLHGLTHDIALAFRSKAAITSFLQKGKKDLDGSIAGFRSPAYSMSQRLLAALDALGFSYDSSFQTFSQFYHSTTFPFPYQYPGLSLVELPVCLNDDIFFRDAKMSDDEALAVTKKLLDQVLDIGGVFVANLHPHNLKGRLDFYRKFLELLKQKIAQSALLATTGKIVELYRSA